jgi:hypothetical protein
MPTRPKLIKMLGTVGWFGDGAAYEGKIGRAILRHDETLAIDLIWGPCKYSVQLKRGDGDRFDGNWTLRSAGATLAGNVSAALYRSSSGHLLFGEWVEVNTRYRWWAELIEVASFPDETART